MALMFLVVTVFIGFHAFRGPLTYTPPAPLPGRETVLPEPARPVWNAPPEEPLPDNGDGFFGFDRQVADSKLRIVPRGDQGHIVLKVMEAEDAAKLVCWVFIRQGESAETPIPAGAYRLKLARGKQWYGEQHLFGPDASYSFITSEIIIPTHTDYTIDLHPSTAGTLREITLNAENF